jgi:hypothetical protein
VTESPDPDAEARATSGRNVLVTWLRSHPGWQKDGGPTWRPGARDEHAGRGVSSLVLCHSTGAS